MKIDIKEKNENILLGRLEIKGLIEFEGVTPSNAQLTEVLAKETKKDSNLVVLKNIYTDFGHQKGTFSAFIYNDLEARGKIEKMTKHLKKKAEESAKTAAEAKASAAEAKAKEAPAVEEKKEEAAVAEKTTESGDSEPAPKEQKPVEEEKKEGDQ